MMRGRSEPSPSARSEERRPTETPFEIVPVPGPLHRCNGARVTLLVEAMGSVEEPAGVAVMVDGRPTGVEVLATNWTPELTLVETMAVADVARMTARAIGDAVVIRAVARPFVDPKLRLVTGSNRTGRTAPPSRRHTA